MAMRLYDAVYEVVGAHADIAKVFDAVPDGWAKIDGEWVLLEEVGLIHQTCSPKTCKHYGVEGAD